jgi:glycosyltransferase involved in cell wall biosynthesis
MLYIFTKSDIGAGGTRHRAVFVADFLHKAGYKAELVFPPMYRAGVSRRAARMAYIKTILSLRKGDTAFLQNPIFNRYFIFLICAVKIVFRPTIIFDFDDATWIQNPIAPKVLAFFADRFIVASHYLSKWPYIKGRPTLVMANLIDYSIADTYGRHAESAGGNAPVVLGWIGNAPDPLSRENLAVLLPAMKALAARKANCVFRIVGTQDDVAVTQPFIDTGIRFESVARLDWGKPGEIQKANAAFDIGLCPLVPGETNEARCSLKVLDYMAAGIPVAISPIGENTYFIEDGVQGFLPKNAGEWTEKLLLLIEDRALREKMGREARAKLEAQYSYQANMQKYIEFLRLDK